MSPATHSSLITHYSSLFLPWLRRPHGLRDLGRDVVVDVHLLEGDTAFHLPLMFGAVDPDVVHAGADDEADHAAAVVETSAVARVHGGVDPIGAGDEVERRHDEAHAPVAVEALRR